MEMSVACWNYRRQDDTLTRTTSDFVEKYNSVSAVFHLHPREIHFILSGCRIRIQKDSRGTNHGGKGILSITFYQFNPFLLGRVVNRDG